MERGFSNWHKATSKFTLHEKSPIHKDVVRVFAGLKQTPISAILSDIAAKEQKTVRNVLEILFRSVAFLAKKGLSFRGDTTRDGVLYELMMERTYNLPKEREWMMRGDNWMSDTIQNEIISQFAHAVQRKIISRASAVFLQSSVC